MRTFLSNIFLSLDQSWSFFLQIEKSPKKLDIPKKTERR
jgi:hypothetical protein